jgi:histidinol-phosphate aminotransferase
VSKTALHLNEMPLKPHNPVLDAAIAACGAGNRYPTDDSILALRTALAKQFGVESDWMTIGNGSLMILHQIMIASGQHEVVYGWPSFADFPVLAQGLRMKIKPVNLCEDGSCDLQKLAENITDKTSLAIVCTPNPPTGGVVKHKAVVEFLRQVPKRVTVLIDEAYGEFVRDKQAVRSLELVREYANVVVSRSFSKAYGLAGFRIGYAIAQPELSAKVSAAGLPRFQISSAAQAAAMAALGHLPEMQSRIDSIVAERHRMADALRALGATVVEGQGNFIWVPVGKLAQHVKDSLARYNVLVHASVPFGVRITVGTSKDTDRLQEAWRNISPLNNVS